MAFITKCDNCNAVYDGGFSGKRQKVVVRGANEFTVEVIIRPPHLCDPCFTKIMRDALKKK